MAIEDLPYRRSPTLEEMVSHTQDPQLKSKELSASTNTYTPIYQNGLMPHPEEGSDSNPQGTDSVNVLAVLCSCGTIVDESMMMVNL